MIIARITSGLGNQLFQYALARSLSLRNQTSLYFDLSYYRQEYATDTPRRFKLDQFAIPYCLLSTSPYHYLSKATKLLPNRSLAPLIRFVKEHQFHVDPQVLQVKAPLTMLEGFWQSEGYFADHAPTIRTELTLQRKLSDPATAYKQAIAGANVSVSIHIRRGDYITHPEFSQSFGFVGLAYYQRAIAHLRERFSNLSLFVFSDDPTWVQQHLLPDTPYVLVQTTGPNADVDDLHLMSCCQHHIMANSSFSWWGAWLDARPDKVVIAPKNWFRHKPDWRTDDLLPPGWLRL